MSSTDGQMKVVKYGHTVAINDEDMTVERRTESLIAGLAGYGMTVEDLEALNAYGRTGQMTRREPCRDDAERRVRAEALLGRVTYSGGQ